MIADIKAEFRKLLTVRSTYVITAICLAFTILIAFYALGYPPHGRRGERFQCIG